MLTRSQIEKNVDWLLANGSPPVKYLTCKHILSTDPKSKQMQTLWKKVETGSDAQLIFSKQNEDGSWFSSGPWGQILYRSRTGKGYYMQAPKYVTTAWILPFLGEMGFTIQDERVKRASEYTISEMEGGPYRKDKEVIMGEHPSTRRYVKGTYVDPDTGRANCCGGFALPLVGLASVGMGSDSRLQGYWEALLKCQRDDGGWLRPDHIEGSLSPHPTRYPWNRSCPWGTHHAAMAFFYSSNPEHKKPLFNALKFQVWHLSQKKEGDIQTWYYHGHNIVKELLIFSETGIDMNARPIKVLLKWLMEFYNPEEGVFRSLGKPMPKYTKLISSIMKDFKSKYGNKYWRDIPKTNERVLRYRLYHLIEDDWLTYYLTRIATNMLELPR